MNKTVNNILEVCGIFNDHRILSYEMLLELAIK